MANISADTDVAVGAEARAAPTSTAGLFVRNSSGLVRELSAFDAFNLVFSAVLVPLGFLAVMDFAPAFWPHANLLVSFLLAAPLLLCFGVVYYYFTVLMPRSGGDYVWLSRTLHPFAGFVVNVSLTYVFLTWVALNLTMIPTIFMPALAYVMGINAGWLANPGHIEMAIILTVLTAGFALLMIRGIRPMARFMAICFAVVWIGILVLVVILGVANHSQFVSSWNANAGTLSYNGIIAKAGSLGFSAAGGISWGATLFAMVYAFDVYCGFQWTGYFSGEIKNIRRTAGRSIFGALAAAVVGYTLLAFLVYRFFGFQFFGSIVFLGFAGGSSHFALPFTPYITQLWHFLPVGTPVQVFLILIFLLCVVWWTPAGFLLGTRNTFAWSFDRLMPERLSSVSDRYHTPVAATVFIACVVEVLILLNIFSNLAGWLLSVIWVLGLALAVVCFAAGWLPWHRPDLHRMAPSWCQRRLAGVPVITWAAGVAGVSWCFVVVVGLSSGFGGSFSFVPMLEAAAVPIAAGAWYFGMRLYRSHSGINLSRVFQEIPPE